MREGLLDLVEKAELALAGSAGVVADEDLQPVAAALTGARIRLAYPEDMIVAALVGGTGSGKSSLLNAIVGSEVAPVGGVRPTTSGPMALVSAGRLDEIAGYLDEIGVSRRQTGEVPGWLCLLDMPDTDSVEVEHRLRVEALLPRLDVLVWVVDPEKYRDAALHNRYLRPLADHAGQFVFVLNQVDRLDPGSVPRVLADFVEALADDGIDAPTVIPTAASPVSGPSVGLPDLVAALRELGSEVGAVYGKLLGDLRDSASRLLEATGGKSLDFDRRSEEALAETVTAIVAGDPGGATATFSGFLETLAEATGGPGAAEIRRIAASTPLHVQDTADELRRIAEAPRPWVRRFVGREDDPAPLSGLAKDMLTDLAVGPTRQVILRRAQANALIADLALSVEALLRQTGR